MRARWYRYSPVIAGLLTVFVLSTTVAWFWSAP